MITERLRLRRLLLPLTDFLRVNIAERHDLHIRPVLEQCHVPGSPVADTDHTEIDPLVRAHYARIRGRGNRDSPGTQEISTIVQRHVRII